MVTPFPFFPFINPRWKQLPVVASSGFSFWLFITPPLTSWILHTLVMFSSIITFEVCQLLTAGPWLTLKGQVNCIRVTWLGFGRVRSSTQVCSIPTPYGIHHSIILLHRLITTGKRMNCISASKDTCLFFHPEYTLYLEKVSLIVKILPSGNLTTDYQKPFKSWRSDGAKVLEHVEKTFQI